MPPTSAAAKPPSTADDFIKSSRKNDSYSWWQQVMSLCSLITADDVVNKTIISSCFVHQYQQLPNHHHQLMFPSAEAAKDILTSNGSSCCPSVLRHGQTMWSLILTSAATHDTTISSCQTTISSWCFHHKQHQKIFLTTDGSSLCPFVLRYRQMMVSLTVTSAAAYAMPSAAVSFIKRCSKSYSFFLWQQQVFFWFSISADNLVTV